MSYVFLFLLIFHVFVCLFAVCLLACLPDWNPLVNSFLWFIICLSIVYSYAYTDYFGPYWFAKLLFLVPNSQIFGSVSSNNNSLFSYFIVPWFKLRMLVSFFGFPSLNCGPERITFNQKSRVSVRPHKNSHSVPIFQNIKAINCLMLDAVFLFFKWLRLKDNLRLTDGVYSL